MGRNDMNIMKNNKGFSLVEMMVVVGIVALIASMAVGISSKMFNRRTVDKLVSQVSSKLQLTRLNALRDGVEYMIAIEYHPGCEDITENGTTFNMCHFLQVIKSIGDSNRASSTFTVLDTYRVQFMEEITTNVDPGFIADGNGLEYIFQPTGRVTDGDGNAIAAGVETPFAVIPIATAKNVKKCGQVLVNAFGRVSLIHGNWDFDSSVCVPILDIAAGSPRPSPV